MNSKIIITGRHKKINDKFSHNSAKKRVSKSKLEDIELGSTIGEIYRKSRNKSAISHRKKRENTKTIYKSMINTKPTKPKKYYTNEKPTEKQHDTLEPSPTKVIKIEREVKNKVDNVINRKSELNQKNSDSRKQYKIKSIPQYRKNKIMKNQASKLPSNKSTSKSTNTTTNLAKLQKKPRSVKKKSSPVKPKKEQTKKADFKIIRVKTNTDSYLITTNLVSNNVLNSDFSNRHHFSQFTDHVDKYLMHAISGGLDINKYHK